MPIHDWTKVTPGIFHDFHHDWITMLKRALNAGRLPPGYYALAEQVAGGLIPDVLALEAVADQFDGHSDNGTTPTAVAVLQTPPKARFTMSAEIDLLARKRSRIAIRHTSGHDVVAMIEIVSPGNKSSRHALRAFVEKAIDFLDAGIHLLIIDLFPPGRRDPQGSHAAIWSEIEEHSFALPVDKPLTLAAYSAGSSIRAYVEAVSVGAELPEMPLFLEADKCILAPLATSYEEALAGVPQVWRRRLES